MAECFLTIISVKMLLDQRQGRRRKRTSVPFFTRVKNDRQRVGLNFRRHRKKIELSRFRPALLLAIELAAVILLAYGTVQMFGIKQQIIGQSMEPTLMAGDEVLLNRLSYRLGTPDAGDMVAFYPNDNRSANVSVKRIIAVPGDTVRIANGAVYVNDILIENVARTDYITESGLAADGILLKPGEYFVLGDNRNNSEDSRYASIGNVTENMIVGKVWLNVTSGAIGFLQ